MHYINEEKQKIVEGQLRCSELSEYLRKIDAPRKIWLSEDATGIVQKTEYDPTSNQLVGLVLPTDKSTGMPVPFTFMARSANEISSHMTKAMASLIYIVMAQPLKENAPPFLLLMYGTDNKFKTVSDLQRWKYIQRELKKYVYIVRIRD